MFEVIYEKDGREIKAHVSVIEITGVLALHKEGKATVKSIKKDDYTYDLVDLLNNLKV